MLYKGKYWQCEVVDGIAELKIDAEKGANVFNIASVAELGEAIDTIEKTDGIKGLIQTSGKDHYIFGADITEFIGAFDKTDEEMIEWLGHNNSNQNRIEDLPYPTCTAINGFALGGGLESCLATDFRVAFKKAKLGVPETKLGLIPGWGGTVRLSRLCGADNAIEWVAGGKQYKIDDAFKIGLVDGVIDSLDELATAARKTVERAIAGELDWKARREQKKSPLKLNKMEAGLVFEGSKGFVAGQAGPNYPAPVNGVMAIAEGAYLDRDKAIRKESEYFIKCARTSTADSLIKVFLGDQYLKKVSKKVSKTAEPITAAAVLGAGIMGGGIAYQSASRGVPVLMKDISQGALDLGLNEAGKLLGKQHKRGKISAEQMNGVMGSITPTLTYGDFGNVSFVTEAVVENLDIKNKVLADLEGQVSDETIIASNTSTLSINDMAKSLKKPERFCGLHFFNPVHRMPLVEVVRGEKTSDETIAKAVKYSLQMGKTPVVVNDCSGFLVNRVLFPYFAGFTQLIEDGVDFQRIDKVMEKWGWPMGPAYLLDVVGIDTADHCTHVIGGAYGDRMKFSEGNIINLLYKADRLGQKNGKGFYSFAPDKRGRIKKTYTEDIESFISQAKKGNADLIDEEIVERTMFPMLFEAVRCLDEKIVETHIEVDMSLLMGLGFPPFRTGVLKWADDIGLSHIVKNAEKYVNLGPLYEVPEILKKMAADNKTFYQGA